MKTERKFPEGFLWGAAASSHQVEGGTDNDWIEWEAAGRTKNRSGLACNHWDLAQFRSDVRLMRELGLNSYRMSLEWSRIMPDEGVINDAALRHYRTMIETLKDAGLTVMVTLHHFTNPRWFVRRGGWVSGPEAPFLAYVRRAAQALGDLVDLWTTFNEPIVLALLSRITGIWPPGERWNIPAAIRMSRRLALSHEHCYNILKADTGRPVGIIHQVCAFEAARDRWTDRALKRLADHLMNNWILDRTTNDFLGVNYYFHQKIGARFWPPGLDLRNDNETVSDFGWEIHSEGLLWVLRDLAARYRLPMYITENGVADAGDRLRAKFIRDHLGSVHSAIGEGADVRGYFHWSLLDNFEWAEGYTKRFGLIEVDFATQRRSVRLSGRLYAYIARGNALPDEDVL